MIKVRADEKANVVASVEAKYKQFFPGNSFEYTYLKDQYNNQYNDDKRFGKIVFVFTALAIIVACLGLIGLSSYTALLRTKEIGIRKVLGASVGNIVSILSIGFVQLVVVAALISLPIAYFGMVKWLETYPYRIDLGWSFFVIPVVIVMIIATVTIAFQVTKAAMTKPVDTLKYE
jgi:putative ABC transport system permease protein